MEKVDCSYVHIRYLRSSCCVTTFVNPWILFIVRLKRCVGPNVHPKKPAKQPSQDASEAKM
ncbi:hypothetical protein K505DRAFT_52568 [Melanomma pulvis-pyrius CBS 109.77]|uniref:Uncharacterized protein n=1 Tax=Melanomma pulvis-pyrius CBS 109.77 TaxID=1314802 RepID=A0A6A6XTS5_9PLEO|nr:hypothetical protein K505DRAFT_52568 [Melanomma pulvis-pyrius CBS 109.77]